MTAICERCGREATFRDKAGDELCEFCPAVEYGLDRGASAAYSEIVTVALLAALRSGAFDAATLHGMVDHIDDGDEVEPDLPRAAPGAPPLERVSERPWLDGMTAISGRGEAILATRKPGGGAS